MSRINPTVAPYLAITAGPESGNKRTITIQAKDSDHKNQTERFRVRTWISTSDYGPPSAAGHSVSPVTGELQEVTPDADYEIISDANGKVEIDITIGDPASRYIMAETDGRIHSSGEVEWT